MDFLPVFARLRDRPCLVVGGGDVASRKVRDLLAAGARVVVNAPALNPSLEALVASGQIAVRQGPFDPGLVGAQLLVIAATSDRAVNHAVAAEAARCLTLCNVVDDPAASSYISPSIVDRSPIIVAVSSGGEAPVLTRLVRQQLDRVLPFRLGAVASWAGGWRDAVRARLPGYAARRLVWEQALQGAAGEHALAGRVEQANAALQNALDETSGAADTIPAGKAWLVGAGPGDPELLTLRAHRAIQHADVILHDRLIDPAILGFARRDAELVDVGKTGGGPSTPQARINQLLVDHVRAGLRVCRLKGGDPLIFGRGAEEAEALAAAGLPYEIVPGITAASGCGSAAGIPLTHRKLAHAVTFVSARRSAPEGIGPDDAETDRAEPDHAEADHAEADHAEGDPTGPDWAALAALGQTLVVYMPARRLRRITAALIEHGRGAGTPAALLRAGTTPAQQLIRGTLADLADRVDATPSAAAPGALPGSLPGPGTSPPAILYVGEVVAWSAAPGTPGIVPPPTPGRATGVRMAAGMQ